MIYSESSCVFEIKIPIKNNKTRKNLFVVHLFLYFLNNKKPNNIIKDYINNCYQL